MYRSTPHSTTGVSPAELLFGRRIRTKLPQLQEFTVEDEVRDRDSERKEKGKVYADCKRNAQESKIQEGDKVLLRQEKENKLSTTYINNLHLQLFKRMVIVFLLRPMVYSTVEM